MSLEDALNEVLARWKQIQGDGDQDQPEHLGQPQRQFFEDNGWYQFLRWSEGFLESLEAARRRRSEEPDNTG